MPLRPKADSDDEEDEEEDGNKIDQKTPPPPPPPPVNTTQPADSSANQSNKPPMTGGFKLPMPNRPPAMSEESDPPSDPPSEDERDHSKQKVDVVSNDKPDESTPTSTDVVPPATTSTKIKSGLAERMAGLGGMPMVMPGMTHPNLRQPSLNTEKTEPENSNESNQQPGDIGYIKILIIVFLIKYFNLIILILNQ
jgi:hypothetical protein